MFRVITSLERLKFLNFYFRSFSTPLSLFRSYSMVVSTKLSCGSTHQRVFAKRWLKQESSELIRFRSHRLYPLLSHVVLYSNLSVHPVFCILQFLNPKIRLGSSLEFSLRIQIKVNVLLHETNPNIKFFLRRPGYISYQSYNLSHIFTTPLWVILR